MKRFLLLSVYIFYATVLLAQPGILYFFPASGSTGTVVRIDGFNLSGATAVNFGGVAAASFSTGVDSVEFVMATVGAGASGSVSITTPDGTANKAGFSYIPSAGSPSITAFWPLSAGAGSTVQIRGNKLDSITAVSFGGTPARSFAILFDTASYINAVVGQGTSGSVSVTNNAGTASKAGFTFIEGPVISSFTPTSGIIDSAVVIRGRNFTGATGVKFNGASAVFRVDSSTRITAIVPSGATSGTIAVTTPEGTGVSSSNFTVNTSYSGTVRVCPGSNATLTSSHIGSSYRWQMQTDSGFVNLANGTNYSGVTSLNLQLIAVPSSWSGRVYRCIVGNSFASNSITLQISNSWSGAAGPSWEDAANWGCSQTVPDANTEVVIKSGTVLLSSNVTVKSISVAPGATFTVKPGFTLTVTGK